MVDAPTFTPGKMTNVGVWRQAFYYAVDEDMVMGSLVRLSDDMTVSAVKNAGGAVEFLSAGVDSPIGICEEDKVAALSNKAGMDMVSVRMFGRFQEEAVIVCGVAAINAGDLITLGTGQKALALTSGTQGDDIVVLIP